MEKIPTAEELMQSKNGDDYTHWEEIHNMMISFAKLHVEAALKAAAEKAEVKFQYERPQSGDSQIVDKESVLKAYPLENIK